MRKNSAKLWLNAQNLDLIKADVHRHHQVHIKLNFCMPLSAEKVKFQV